MKKKILFLTPLPPPVYGAAISSELCLNSELLNKEFEIRHIQLNYSKEFEDIGRFNFRKIIGFFKTNLKIIKNLISFKPDLIYFVLAPKDFGFFRDCFFVFNCKLFRKRILFHLRAKGIQKEIKNPLKYFLYKLIFRNTKSIILDESQYSDISKLVKRQNVFVLPNAIQNKINNKEFKQIIKKRKKGKSSNILFLSNMSKTKGLFLLLEACKILKKQKINFKCNFVGAWKDNKTKIQFENYVSKYELKDIVKYLGFKSGKEKKDILIDSDIFVFPTFYESFGLVILEAMQYGLPVVANGISAIPSIIKQNETGFALEQNTPEEFAKHLKILLDKKADSIKMGEKARKRFLQNYCFEKYEPKLASIFKEY